MKKRFINGCSKSISLVMEFEKMGWDSWTCDILPSEGWDKHIQDDILKHLNDGWDFGIFHPDCTRLANSGVRWFHDPLKDNGLRHYLMVQDAKFFNLFLNLPFPSVVENPIQHKYARMLIRKYDQLVQPHYFGEYESKAICLWLNGVPELKRTHWIQKDLIKQSVWKEAPNPDRKANRARNFPAVSKAMANQWSNFLIGSNE